MLKSRKSLLFVLIYLVAVGIACYAKYQLEFGHQQILDNPGRINAKIIKISEQHRYKRGRKITRYGISYEFHVNQKAYGGLIEASSKGAEKFLKSDEIDVVYDKQNPVNNKPWINVKDAKGLTDLVPTFLHLALVLFPFVLIGFLFLDSILQKISGKPDPD